MSLKSAHSLECKISGKITQFPRASLMCCVKYQHVLFVLDCPARTQPGVTWYAWPPAGLTTQIVGRQTYSGKWYSVCLRYKRTILGKIHRMYIKVRVLVRYVTNLLLFGVAILWYSARFAEPIWSGLYNTLSYLCNSYQYGLSWITLPKN